MKRKNKIDLRMGERGGCCPLETQLGRCKEERDGESPKFWQERGATAV